MHVIPRLGNWKQEDREFKTSLDYYTLSSKPALNIQ